jgi:hypothetical protein
MNYAARSVPPRLASESGQRTAIAAWDAQRHPERRADVWHNWHGAWRSENRLFRIVVGTNLAAVVSPLLWISVP